MLGNAVPPLLQHVRRLAASTSSDEQLLADFLARRGDEAFAALIGRHGPMVLNVCRRILHDAHAAEDVFQATFLVLANRAAALHRPAALAGFLHGVAYRLAVRARRRQIQSRPAAVCDRGVAPVDELAWKEVLGILDHELSQLSDRYRAPLVLCYLEGRTQDEAARQLGWGLNTLRRRLVEGRRLLEARLRGRGVTLPAALAGLLAASAVEVPGSLRAATVAGVGARLAGGGAAGLSSLGSGGKGFPLGLSPVGKKVGALAALTALVSAIGFVCCLAPPVDQAGAPAAGTSRGDPATVPLPDQGTVRLGTAQYRHGSRIESFTVSADGKLAAVSSGWRSFAPARVFDLTEGRCLYSLPHMPDRGIEAVGLSPDGKTLATKDNRFLTFWDAATGRWLRTIDYGAAGGGRSVTNWLSFSPDGKRLAATLLGHEVQLIDVASGKVKGTFDRGAAARACVFSPDGKHLATGGYAQEDGVYYAQLWDVATGNELRRFAVGHERNQPIESLAFSHDGTRLAGACWRDGRLRLFEVATGRELRTFPRIGENVPSVAFSPDGKTVAAAGDAIHLYDLASGKERLRIELRAQGLAFNRDGSVLTGAIRGAIYRWDTVRGRQLTPAAAQDTGVEQILVSSGGRSLFTTDQDGNLYGWDTAGGNAPSRISGGIERGVVASPDGRYLAWTEGADSSSSAPPGRKRPRYGARVRLYDIASRRFIDRLPGFAEQAAVVAFRPDGKALLTLGVGVGVNTVRLWDIETGKELRSFVVTRISDPKAPPARRGSEGIPFYTSRRAALSPDGKILAIGPDWEENLHAHQDEPLRLWDIETGKERNELKLPPNVRAIPNESGTGTIEDSGLVRVNRKLCSAAGRAFSPDGRLLADWAENPYGPSRMDHLVVWDVATGRVVANLDSGPRGGATNAVFAPDGRTLATAAEDGAVRLWEVTTWKVRSEYRGHRDRVTALAFAPDGRLFTGGLDTVVLGWDVRPPQDASKGNFADAWMALAGADAQAAFEAQGRFLAEPGKAAPWLAARMAPVRRPNLARVKALVARLDHEDFAQREKATADLQAGWPFAEAALREAAAKSSSDEVRRRAERIVRQMEKCVPPGAELRSLRAVEVLAWIDTREARAALSRLAEGAPEARLTRAAAAACKRLQERK
jgi:RNA polymerase sigma factor (sigma-70 family)